MPTNSTKIGLSGLAAVVYLTLGAQSALAQGMITQPQAAAAQLEIILGVSQGISSLPPTAGQSFVWEWDETLSSFKPDDRLGPTSFRSPLTIGKNRMSLRVATSYFSLSSEQRPIGYAVKPRLGANPFYTQLGQTTNAKVGLLNVSQTYGILDWLELNVNFPITVVHAQSKSVFAQIANPLESGSVALFPSEEDFNDAIAKGFASFGESSYEALGLDFNEGTSAGLGRVALGGKAELLHGDVVSTSLSMEVFLPSPNQTQYSGPSSFAFLPRLITAIHVLDDVDLRIDAGYNGDTKFDELSSFVWNTGVSYSLPRLTFDTGFGGSKFNQGIAWTPSTFVERQAGLEFTYTALGDNTLGTNYVDYLFGAKFEVLNGSVISGSVNVPINNQGIRPVAVGTIAFEVYF